MKVSMMSRARKVKRALAPGLALLAAGCFGGGSAPAELLTLTPTTPVPPGTARSATAAGTLAVLTPTVPRAINTRRVPVYVSPITIEYLVGATWVEEPQELFRRLLAETVAARTGQLVLDPNNFAQEAGSTLSGQLLQFGFDPTRMEAVVVYEAALSRRGQSLRTQRFEARVPVTGQDAASVTPALNQAANQVAEQVAGWVGG
jgi:cholesterol transport system auxiliary component